MECGDCAVNWDEQSQTGWLDEATRCSPLACDSVVFRFESQAPLSPNNLFRFASSCPATPTDPCDSANPFPPAWLAGSGLRRHVRLTGKPLATPPTHSRPTECSLKIRQPQSAMAGTRFKTRKPLPAGPEPHPKSCKAPPAGPGSPFPNGKRPPAMQEESHLRALGQNHPANIVAAVVKPQSYRFPRPQPRFHKPATVKA